MAAVMFALGSTAVAPAGAHQVVEGPVDLADLQQPLPAGVVARVDDPTITNDQYEHWRLITAATTGLSSRDVRGRVALRRQVMEFLLQELWVRLEAPAHRVRVSDAEADRAFNLSKRESFESERDFRDFLEKSKMTEADARFQIRSNELYLKLRRHATKRARSDTGKRRLADRFERRLRRKWRMRTACGLRHRSAECGHTVPAHPLPEGP